LPPLDQLPFHFHSLDTLRDNIYLNRIEYTPFERFQGFKMNFWSSIEKQSLSPVSWELSAFPRDIWVEIGSYLLQPTISYLFASFDRRMQRNLISPGVFSALTLELPISQMSWEEIYLWRSANYMSALRIDGSPPVSEKIAIEISTLSYLTQLTTIGVDGTSLPPAYQLSISKSDACLVNWSALLSGCQISTLRISKQSFFTASKLLHPDIALALRYVEQLPRSLTSFQQANEKNSFGFSKEAYSAFPPGLTSLDLSSTSTKIIKGHQFDFSALRGLPNSLTRLHLECDSCNPHILVSVSKKNKSSSDNVGTFGFNGEQKQEIEQISDFPANLERLELSSVRSRYFSRPICFSNRLNSFKITSHPADPNLLLRDPIGLSHIALTLQALPSTIETLEVLFKPSTTYRREEWIDLVKNLTSLKTLRFSSEWISAGVISASFNTFLSLEEFSLIASHSTELKWIDLPPKLKRLYLPNVMISSTTFNEDMIPKSIEKLSIGSVPVSMITGLLKARPNICLQIRYPIPWDLDLCNKGDTVIDANSLSALFASQFGKVSIKLDFDDIALSNRSIYKAYEYVTSVNLSDGFSFFERFGYNEYCKIDKTPGFSISSFPTSIFREMPRLTSLKLFGNEMGSIDMIVDCLPPTLTELDLGMKGSRSDISFECLPASITVLRARQLPHLSLISTILPPNLKVLDIPMAFVDPRQGRMSFPKSLEHVVLCLSSAAFSNAWKDEDIHDLIKRIPNLKSIECSSHYPAQMTGYLIPTDQKIDSMEASIAATMEILANPSPNRTLQLKFTLSTDPLSRKWR
jgi:hypothetical protein